MMERRSDMLSESMRLTFKNAAVSEGIAHVAFGTALTVWPAGVVGTTQAATGLRVADAGHRLEVGVSTAVTGQTDAV